VIGGKREGKVALDSSVARRLEEMYLAGAKAKEAVAAVSGETGLPKKALYQAWLRLGRPGVEKKESCRSLERSK
jgi:hypothetical protein